MIYKYNMYMIYKYVYVHLIYVNVPVLSVL